MGLVYRCKVMLETVLEIGVDDVEEICVAQDTDSYESLLTC